MSEIGEGVKTDLVSIVSITVVCLDLGKVLLELFHSEFEFSNGTIALAILDDIFHECLLLLSDSLRQEELRSLG